MSILSRLFPDRDQRAPYRPLYDAVVAEARTPIWYLDGGVPDTVDGRFDMVALVLALVLIRLEGEDEAGRLPSTLLTELFVDDMDGQLRQIGVGDVVVGKHVGRMMSALGGRITAYRAALAGDAPLADALGRNLWRGEAPAGAAITFVENRVRALHAALAATPAAALYAGKLPTP
ncbi:cytochrome b pre-mRNA-processing protein 3 [Sphingomonas laterariae]|uniref:Cytochrome b pre-mRNA-processing protein 3 n=1 Tax=Edaphosphingomonas laterariae TaxID=861865 RepID=A0A239FK67_9SPHN|nr:ubiquinol-cytochrome C chaperone family protein [Sphingomonas laterariae]SNS56693.1 cytochrome b pre-mRNA-processing protein 3 [Sphingomonas laterariae]